MDSLSSESQPHAVLFPFMSKGHTIPILHMSRSLLSRGLAITIFTSPANRTFISQSLCDTKASVIDIPFPDNVPGIPAGIESTDKLPCMSLFPQFALATELMQAEFERHLEAIQPVSFMVSDGFLWWTLDSATKFGIPRLVSYGMSCYAMTVSRTVATSRLLHGPKSEDELVTVTEFPWIKITRNDFHPSKTDPEPKGPYFEFFMKCDVSCSKSYGYLFNSFYELEPLFVDYFNAHFQPKGWCVGPLCLAEPPKVGHSKSQEEKSSWMQWLDEKLTQGCSVLYVAFGSQAQISQEQLREIALGLESSKVNFLWVTRKKESELPDGFKERVKDRGIVVNDWVDQREILMHPSVEGFLSHCGWNSVSESICEGVPILAWPMMADQPLNARFVVEEINVGLRVQTCNGSVKGFVKWESLEKMIKELMEGENGRVVRDKVKKFAYMAKNAFEGDGSSSQALDHLIAELCK